MKIMNMEMERNLFADDFQIRLENEIVNFQKDFGNLTPEEIKAWVLRDYRFTPEILQSPNIDLLNLTKYIRNLMAKALKSHKIDRNQVGYLKEQLRTSGGRDNFRTLAILNILFEVLGEAKINQEKVEK